MGQPKFTPAEEAWFAECQKDWAPLDEFQVAVLRRNFRPTVQDRTERGAA